MSEGSQHIVLSYHTPVVLDAYDGLSCFRDPKKCAYCGQPLRTTGKFYYRADCTCGWWYDFIDNDACNDGWTAVIAGALQRYPIDSPKIPVEVLQSELREIPSLVRHINPRRMEDLVAAILRGVLSCDVVHLGYSRDGGIDLLLLHSDDPIAVQVKRRTREDAVEGVSVIRELLGASLLSGHHRALFVTTAARFSRDATNAATKAMDLGLVRSFELTDYNKLVHYLQQAPTVPASEVALDRHRPQDWRRSNGIVRQVRELLGNETICFEDIISNGVN